MHDIVSISYIGTAIKPRSAETAIQATITTAETAVQANYLAVAPG